MSMRSLDSKGGSQQITFFRNDTKIKYVWMPNWHDPRNKTEIPEPIIDYMHWRFGDYKDDWMWREPSEKQKRGEPRGWGQPR